MPDIFRIPEFIRKQMFVGKLDLSAPINVDPDRFDQAAVAFACDDLTAACIADVVRSHDRRVGDYPCRAYVRRARAWSKVTAAETLSIVVGGRPMLNPNLFKVSMAVERMAAEAVL